MSIKNVRSLLLPRGKMVVIPSYHKRPEGCVPGAEGPQRRERVSVHFLRECELWFL